MRIMTSVKVGAMATIVSLATSASADELAVCATLTAVFPQTPIEGVAETPSAAD